MRFLIAFLILHSVAVAATDGGLAALKKQFPGHTAGPVTERSDPAIIQCYRKYEARVAALALDSLPLAIQRLKDDAAQEVREIEWRLQDPKNRIKSSTRFAEEKNGTWLKQKLIPFIKRIEQYQRGR